MENRMEILKKRKRHCVCRFCGNKLELKRMLFHDIDEARTEIFCYQCERIEYGTEREIYEVARCFVEEFAFDFHMGEGNKEKNKRYTIAKICDILGWGLRKMGYLDAEGFRIKPELDMRFMQEAFLLSDKDLMAEGREQNECISGTGQGWSEAE